MVCEIALTLLLTFGGWAGQTSVPKHPVEEFFMSGIAAFNAHDLDLFMKQFAPDIEMYTPTGWLRGQESVRKRFAETFQQFANVRMDIDDLRVREVAGRVAITDFK
ncbi:MAG: nuclear transport factor 2 family protein [Acidobacteria bacterium]|nr:nuclear transport factor 2 family protein [Acidobacteriota bacterium]